jgi:proteasome lid subunit RPN8/RPN11
VEAHEQGVEDSEPPLELMGLDYICERLDRWVLKGGPPPVGPGELSSRHWFQAHLIRDITGNLFRYIALNTAWLTPTVASLAQAAYEERLLPVGSLERSRLAVLADAVEEAGCDNADILSHLRGPGPHVRGCWALDLLLGKEEGRNRLEFRPQQFVREWHLAQPAPFRLRLPREVYGQMVGHAQREAPTLCLGFLAGKRLEVAEVTPSLTAVRCYPLVNALASEKEYESDVASTFKAEKDRIERRLDTLAIYHSVMDAEPVPSKLALERHCHGPDVMRLIISLRRDGTVREVRGWWFEQDSFREAAWELIDGNA